MPAACMLVLPLLAGRPAAAQVPDSIRADSALVRLGDIRVRAIAPLVTVGGTSALRIRLDSLAMPPAATMEDVVRRIPLLHVRTNSRGEAELTARGSESRQVAVLVDGIPLTLGWDGRTDLSVLPATAPVAVTVLRGLSSMLHGPNVLAGAVELSVVGEHIDPPRSAEVSSAIDHTGGWAVSGQGTVPIRGSSGTWLLRGGGSYSDSPGAPLARGVNEPLPAGHRLRLNTDFRSADGFAAARYRADGGAWFSASSFGFRGRRGVAAELDNASPRFWRYPHVQRAVTTVSGGTGFHRTPLGTGDLEASVALDMGRTEIDGYSSRTYDERNDFEDGDDRTLIVRLLGDHSLGARGDLSAAFTLADIHHDERIPNDTAVYQQRLYSLGLESVWSLADRVGPLRNVRFSAGGAFDAGSTPRTGAHPPHPPIRDWGGRAGLDMATASGTRIHGGFSRRGRFPALREAFSGSLDRFEPNPALSPEHLTAFEAGVTTGIGAARVQVVGFHHRLDDVIVRTSLPDGRFQRVNENEMRSTGIEVLASRTIRRISLGGDLMWQRVELNQPSVRQAFLENQPELSWGIHLEALLPAGVGLATDARYTGVQYCLGASGEAVPLAARTRLDGSVDREFRIRPQHQQAPLSRVAARIAIDNVANIAIYDQCGLPQPGRLLRLQLRIF